MAFNKNNNNQNNNHDNHALLQIGNEKHEISIQTDFPEVCQCEKGLISSKMSPNSALEAQKRSHENSGCSPEKIEGCEESLESIDEESDEDAISVFESPGIQRRNGFKKDKTRNTAVKAKKEANNARRKRSKAKHLWIAFGRKIVNYAFEKAEGEDRKRIEEYRDKLTSKKAYADAFRPKKGESAEDKLFRKNLAAKAVEFVRNESEDAFLSSNYRNELVAQKEKVAKWIETLLG